MEERQIVARDDHAEDVLLPDTQIARKRLQAIRNFQQMCQTELKRGHDYGIIPGTGNKATLLKPGAEKIAKLLSLADSYEIITEVKDWDKGFFAYTIRCLLTDIRSGLLVSTGLGECNSMEAKYRYRWVFHSELDNLGIRAETCRSKPINTRNGKTKVYRIENEDIYSQVNTLLKMAKKRALVDAALSAGRLSDIFTQDMEEIAVDTTTGEIMDNSAAPQGRVVEAAAYSRPAEVPIEAPKNMGEFFNYCWTYFKLSKPNVLKLLNKYEADIADLAQEWATIRAIKMPPEEAEVTN